MKTRSVRRLWAGKHFVNPLMRRHPRPRRYPECTRAAGPCSPVIEPHQVANIGSRGALPSPGGGETRGISQREKPGLAVISFQRDESGDWWIISDINTMFQRPRPHLIFLLVFTSFSADFLQVLHCSPRGGNLLSFFPSIRLLCLLPSGTSSHGDDVAPEGHTSSSHLSTSSWHQLYLIIWHRKRWL